MVGQQQQEIQRTPVINLMSSIFHFVCVCFHLKLFSYFTRVFWGVAPRAVVKRFSVKYKHRWMCLFFDLYGNSFNFLQAFPLSLILLPYYVTFRDIMRRYNKCVHTLSHQRAKLYVSSQPSIPQTLRNFLLLLIRKSGMGSFELKKKEIKGNWQHHGTCLDSSCPPLAFIFCQHRPLMSLISDFQQVSVTKITHPRGKKHPQEKLVSHLDLASNFTLFIIQCKQGP